eukprot:GFUD01140010.1.p1 GENE.GFUD01140010.1~~GFUD01140010.1.p1  ORF type:complete len:865 (+),score=172.38 GFUD01140010.1:385-2595(+)
MASLRPNQDRTQRLYINSSDDSLYLDYGVYSEELEQPLLVGPEKALHYGVLVNTPHGRHLLMVSLLEQSSGDTWGSKCGGKLNMFLPVSLRSSYQPPPPLGACLLSNIVMKNRVIEREEVMEKLDGLVPQDLNDDIFSWFNETHRSVIHSLVDWVLEQETFGSSFSLLVTINEKLSKKMFVELVNLVIAGREDTGFVMPSIESYMPENFFSQEYFASFYGSEVDEDDLSTEDEDLVEEDNRGRGGRSLPGWPSQEQHTRSPATRSPATLSQTTRSPTTRIPTTRVASTTRPTRRLAITRAPSTSTAQLWSRSSLDEAEWYFREDPVANSHHTEWHRMSLGGEYFYYMHGQMLARYEGERLSLGLGLTTHFGPSQWNQRISDSYDPRIGGSFRRRPAGRINSGRMQSLVGQIQMSAISNARRGYVRGRDTGIEGLGRRMERGLHNMGHSAISEMSGGRGVMGSSIGAMRDPIFYRWHGFVDSVFKDYKNRLSPYTEEDLGFPGVRVTASVEPQEGESNTFYTYREMATVRLNGLNNAGPGTRTSLQYSRMNHRQFTWNIVVSSDLPSGTPAIVRVFMLPTRGGDNRVTIHMDHFYMDLNPGENRISREELEAPHLSKSRWSLSELQDDLMNGQVDRGQFSWGGCGWPRHLNVPRGTERGMDWTVVVMVSKMLSSDRSRLDGWAANQNMAWSYCGVKYGGVPDSRPLGFPADRDFGSVSDLVGGRSNWAVVPVRIVHG